MFGFEVTHVDGTARRGVLTTPHGAVQTPAFMPVGTAGSVRGVTPAQLRATGAEMILANTYHLQLRPSADVVRDLGGLHEFMGWDGPILTDSGGYQVFSLAGISKITDTGVEFRSHVDGAPVYLDPQTAIEIQNKLGADIIMAFDDCPPLPCSADRLQSAVDRSLRWAAQCRDAHARRDQALFGIVQGGLELSLRAHCADALIRIGFDGYALGGLSVGESYEEMAAVLGPIAALLPADKPRYLMGVGMPGDVAAAAAAGIDLFDCVLPTRNGRNSWAFTAGGIVKLRNEVYRRDTAPIEPGCGCETCRRFSRGYLRHLFNAGEMLGPTLASIHNLSFYQRFMARVRELICRGKLATIAEEYPIAAMTGTPCSEENA